MPDNPAVPLHNGSMPLLGFGTWTLQGDACQRAVALALECGYRHIDTALGYENHASVGAGLRDGGVPRGDFFLTTKVGPHQLAHDDVLRAADQSLRELQVDYLDLFLAHWPNKDIPIAETLRAMRKLLDDGVIRNCGVSNFSAERVAEAVGTGIAPVSNNQVEYHAHLNQKKLQAACRGLGVVVTAYSPLARGRLESDPVLAEVGGRYGKSPSQVALRWLLQRGISAIPKASSREHIEENLGALGWELSPEDFAAVDSLDAWDRVIGWELSGPNDRAINGG